MMTRDDAQYLSELAHLLDCAPREGALVDSPEGSRYIQISDTFAQHMTRQLRNIVCQDVGPTT